MTANNDSFHHARDLAGLPEPRFVYATPLWLRMFVTALAALGAILGGAMIVEGLTGGGWPYLAAGAPLFCVVAWLFAALRPHDGRSSIVLAADRSGLYLVGRKRRVVFVPWPDVHDIAVETRITGRGEASFARLTLTLPEGAWPRLSRFAAIEGDGATRSYTVPAVAKSGEDVAAALRALREGGSGP